jgi:site-specific recombinase XerD
LTTSTRYDAIPDNAADPDTSLAIAAAATSYHRHLAARGVSENTIATYLQGISRFTRFLAESGMPEQIGSIRREHVEHFLVHLRNDGKKPSTVETYFRALRGLFGWAVAEDEIDRSPLEKMGRPEVPQDDVPVLTVDQLEALVREVQVRKDDAANVRFEKRRDAAIIWMMLESGLRRGELAGLDMADVDLANGTAIVTRKGGFRQVVAIGPRTGEALDRYLRARRKLRRLDLQDHPALWLSMKGRFTPYGIAQMIRRRGEAAGIDGLHAHQFRHTWAHTSLSNGMTEGDVQVQGGWKSRQMLSRYGRSAPGERSRAAFRRANLYPNIG